MTLHISLGNAALASLNNVAYDIGSTPLAASNTAGSGSFSTAGVDAGILSSQVVVQGLSILLEPTLASDIYALSAMGPNAAGTASYSYSGDGTKLSITVPLDIPLQFDVGDLVLNGTMSGRLIATANVPEPATLILGGLGGFAFVTARRRRAWAARPMISQPRSSA